MDKFVKVDILKHSGKDCSNHGVTSRVNETILFANGLTFADMALICQEQGFDIHNALKIVTTIYSSLGVVKYAKPVELLDRHTMFGGCFAIHVMHPLPGCWARKYLYLLKFSTE